MDTYEATKIVLSRIQSLDPENASKITGYILIQDQGEKEMIRLAFSPESLLVSYVSQAKVCLGLSSSKCSTPSTPSSVSPFTATTANSNPLSSLNRCNPFSQTSPRVVIPNTRFHLNNPSSPSSPWSARSPRSASYAAVVNGSTNTPSGLSSSSLSSPFFGNNNANDLSDEFSNIQVQDQLPFLEEPLDPMVSPSRRSDSVTYPYETCEDNSVANHQQQLHRRSFSVNDVFLGGGEDGGVGGSCGFGWRPCLYFAKGFCKNGNTCKFLHSGGGFGAGDPLPDGGPLVGSPGKLDGFDELLKLKAFQQQRLAQQLMASGAPPLLAYNKCATFPSDNQRSAAAAAAFAMGDEFLKLGRCRPDRSDLYTLGFGGSVNSASRQIYLTFPADSTFKEEDVSKYFSIYGPVQDVRIPYQQKRMFGFVTFLYAETVKLILAKGNPHFVCDSRVLVKPYKEKGKIPDKKERGDFSGCLSPSGHESRDLFDLPYGSRMFCNAQEIILRRKFEQEAELKQAIELHGRRLMNMQLMDLKNHHPNQFQTSMLSGHSNNHPNLNPLSVVNGINSDVHEDTNSPTAVSNELQVPGSPGGNKDDNSNAEESDFLESLENVLPDNLFASPTKSDADMNSAFASDDIPITSANYISMLPTAAHKSCYFQMSRFSSGQEAAEI